MNMSDNLSFDENMKIIDFPISIETFKMLPEHFSSDEMERLMFDVGSKPLMYRHIVKFIIKSGNVYDSKIERKVFKESLL